MVATSAMSADSNIIYQCSANLVAQSQMGCDANRVFNTASAMSATSLVGANLKLYWEDVPDITEIWTDEMPFRRVA